MKPYTVSKYFPYSFFSHTVTKMDKVARIKRKLVLEKFTAAKVLEINIPNPILGNTIISEIVQMLQE